MPMQVRAFKMNDRKCDCAADQNFTEEFGRVNVKTTVSNPETEQPIWLNMNTLPFRMKCAGCGAQYLEYVLDEGD